MNVRFAAALALVPALVAGLVGCGGGGGGGSGNGDNTFTSLEIVGIGPPLANQAGATTPIVVQGVRLNAPLIFRFGGAVEPASLPACGAATGSINITTQTTQGTVAAQGTWEIDPLDPSILRFNPLQPSDPASGCTAGFLPSPSTTNLQVYTIFIPRGSSPGSPPNPQVLIVDGEPLAREALFYFATVTCQTSNPAPAFADPVPGPPTVTSSTPPSVEVTTTCGTIGSVSLPTVSPAGLVQVVITISEPVRPDTVTLSTFRLLNLTANCNNPPQIPGTVSFLQAGSCSGGSGAQLTYQASVPLAVNSIFRIDLSPQIVDFGGNAVQIDGLRLFKTLPGTQVISAQINEPFTSVENRASVSGVANWDGSGTVYATFPLEVVGTGADGPFAPASSMAINTNAAQGLYNYTQITVNNGVTLTITGAYPAQFRCQGPVTIAGVLLSSGAAGAAGTFNTGEGTPPAGGNGGTGAGRGGNASPLTIQSDFGEAGFGATLNGAANNNNPPNELYGGGGGGGIANSTNNGGAGGGGASGRFSGSNGIAAPPPVGGTAAIPGLAGPLPAAMQPPATSMAAGSGGGAGGDRDDGPPGNVALDDTGGAGGGGGGGIRISSVGSVAFNSGANIQVNGGGGGAGAAFAGSGGGGSGGMIWVQSFGDVTVSSGVNMLAQAGSGNTASNDGGNGGGGLIQIEDSNGTVTTTGAVFTPPNPYIGLFPYSVAVVGTAISKWFDTGSIAPNFNTPTEVFSTGTNGTVTIRYRGAYANLGGTGADPATAFPPVGQPGVLASEINQLDGYQFISFEITLSFPPPPASNLSTILPVVDALTIPYSYEQ